MKKTFLAAVALSALLASCNKDMKFDACGQIDAVQINVAAENSGKILSLNINEGDMLKSGQMIGCIDSVQTFLQVQELRSRIAGAKTRMVDIDTQLEPSLRQLENMENDLKVYTSLLESNAATQKQVDDMKYKIAIQKSQIDAQRQSWENNNESIRSDIATYEVQLAQRLDQLAKCRITAPSDGTVLSKFVEEGESVNTGKVLFKIADMQSVYVKAYFTGEQLGSLRLGDRLTVIPDDGSDRPKEYTGTLTWISEHAEFTPKNIQTRNERADLVYAVKIRIPNDGSLRIGMYAYVRK